MSDRRTDEEAPSRPRAGWHRAAPVIGLALAALLMWWSGATGFLAPESLLASRDMLALWVAQNWLAALLVFFILYLAMAALSIPGATFLSILSGFLFGAWVGGLVSVLGATLGSGLLFLAVRAGFGETLRMRAGAQLSKLRAGFHADAASYMLFLRLTPAFPFWLVNLASALMGIPLKTFLWTTCLGVMPATFVFAFAGVGLESILAAHQASYEACLATGGQSCVLRLRPADLVTRELLFALAGLGVLSLLPVAARRWRRGRAAGEHVP